MGLEGHIEIRLNWDGQRIAAAHVRSRRPQLAARLLVGQPVAAAVARVPLVFSVCARAQAAAAEAATAAASGRAPADTGLRVLAESVHESFWRIFCDWSDLLGEERDTASLSRLRQALLPLIKGEHTRAGEAATVCRKLLADVVLAEAVDAWLAALAAGRLDAWIAAGKSVPARLLARLPKSAGSGEPLRPLPALAAVEMASALTPALADPGFPERPAWAGLPAETGPMARVTARVPTAGSSLQRRLLARLVDCADWVARLAATDDCATNVIAHARGDDGRGWGIVDTARGTLIHVAGLAGEQIADYRIIAPTEWNFHPQGPFAGLVVGAAADSEAAAEQLAALAVQALDPCVAHRVEIVHA